MPTGPTRRWEVRPMGAVALLIDDVADPAGLANALSALAEPFIDVVPAARTVLVTVASESDLDRVRAVLDSVEPDDAPRTPSESVIIDVRYEGDDLADVAAATGLSVPEVIQMHSAADYRVRFCGFAPGFAYLAGLPVPLHLPRRPTPRTRVPAGSVAIAAEYSAVYPTGSPGGWHLLGTTTARLFDPARTRPATLTPGTRVVFRPA